MVSISPEELSLELLNQCLRGNSYSSELLETLLRMAMSADAEMARHASHALFTTVVERLGDLFEPCLADCYAALFCETIEYALPNLRKEDLLARFRRIRMPRPFRADPGRYSRIVVLSRVTLGADVAIVSLFLDAARQVFPHAEIFFAGPVKNYQLFAADPRIQHLEIPYPREGTLTRRLGSYAGLRDALWRDDTLVLDPDSRLTQLGLLPVCEEDQFFFFESRTYGEYSSDPLPVLAQQWLAETFGVRAKPFLAPAGSTPGAAITVSLGVGENPQKRIGGEFERDLLRLLHECGQSILVDRGGSPEEAARVDAAVAGLDHVQTFSGPFASFAGAIARSGLYCGYDSAGQHVAAVSGVPLVTIFAGFPSQRFLSRWTPFGPGPKAVVVGDPPDANRILKRCRAEIDTLRG